MLNYKSLPSLANRNEIVFYHDNARLHASLATRLKLLELSLEVMPYLLDITTLNFHIF